MLTLLGDWPGNGIYWNNNVYGLYINYQWELIATNKQKCIDKAISLGYTIIDDNTSKHIICFLK